MRNSKSSGAGRARPRRGASRGGMLIGIFIGLVLGVVIAFGIAWYVNKTPVPFQNKPAKPEVKPPGAAPGSATAPGAPAPLPGKPGDKPRFDFYQILPEGEKAMPAPAAKPEAADAGTEPAYLQVGAFQNPADADNLKAKLALMGLEASVVQVSVPDKGTVHRVRLGPFARPEDMNRTRKELAQNGVQASVVKGK
jgi:cell division protein FtsN